MTRRRLQLQSSKSIVRTHNATPDISCYSCSISKRCPRRTWKKFAVSEMSFSQRPLHIIGSVNRSTDHKDLAFHSISRPHIVFLTRTRAREAIERKVAIFCSFIGLLASVSLSVCPIVSERLNIS